MCFFSSYNTLVFVDRYADLELALIVGWVAFTCVVCPRIYWDVLTPLNTSRVVPVSPVFDVPSSCLPVTVSSSFSEKGLSNLFPDSHASIVQCFDRLTLWILFNTGHFRGMFHLSIITGCHGKDSYLGEIISSSGLERYFWCHCSIQNILLHAIWLFLYSD